MKALNRCVCPQKNEKQNKKPVTHSIRNKKIKRRTRSSEYPNTKIKRKKVHQKISAVSRI